jgi:hypothetical protein
MVVLAVASGCSAEGPEVLAQVLVLGVAESEPPTVAMATFTPLDGSEPAEREDVFPDLETCAPDEPVADSTGAFEAVTPGVVTVDLGGELVDLDATGMATLDHWPGGGALGVSNAGGDVPDFDAAGVATLPAMPDGIGTIEADGAYAIAWTPGPSDATIVSMSWEDGSIDCTVEDDGAFTVPADALLGPAEEAVAVVMSRFAFIDAEAADGRVWVAGFASAGAGVR